MVKKPFIKANKREYEMLLGQPRDPKKVDNGDSDDWPARPPRAHPGGLWTVLPLRRSRGQMYGPLHPALKRPDGRRVNDDKCVGCSL